MINFYMHGNGYLLLASVRYNQLVKDSIQRRFLMYQQEAKERWGHMYVADDRFKNNIDKHADGTAAFICEAITIYCNK